MVTWTLPSLRVTPSYPTNPSVRERLLKLEVSEPTKEPTLMVFSIH